MRYSTLFKARASTPERPPYSCVSAVATCVALSVIRSTKQGRCCHCKRLLMKSINTPMRHCLY